MWARMFWIDHYILKFCYIALHFDRMSQSPRALPLWCGYRMHQPLAVRAAPLLLISVPIRLEHSSLRTIGTITQAEFQNTPAWFGVLSHPVGAVYFGPGPVYFGPGPGYFGPGPGMFGPGPVYFSPGLVYFGPGPVYFCLGPVYFGPGPVHFGPGPVYFSFGSV